MDVSSLSFTHIDPREGCVQVTVTHSDEVGMIISKNGYPVPSDSSEAALLLDELVRWIRRSGY
jgi:hypothetical protein